MATFDLGLLKNDTWHPYRLQSDRCRLTRLLRDRLAAGGDVDFVQDAWAIDLRQDADAVYLTIARADGSTEKLSGDFLIGIDGARSAVRQAAGIGFEGMTSPEICLALSAPFAFQAAIPQLANIACIAGPAEWFLLLQTRLLQRLLLPTDPAEPEERMMAAAAPISSLKRSLAKARIE